MRQRDMHWRWRVVAAAGLTALAALCPPAFADSRQRIQDSEHQLKELRSTLESLSSQVEKDRGKRDALSREASQLERRIAAARGELTTLERDIAAQQQQLTAIERRERDAELALSGLRQELAGQLRAAYVIGRSPQTRVMLAQDDITRVSRVLVYFDYFGRAQRQRLSGLQDGLAELASLREQLRTGTESLQAMRERQKQAVAALEHDRAERQTTIAKLDAELRAAGSRKGDLEREAKQLTDLVGSLRRALEVRPAPPPAQRSGSGQGQTPVSGPFKANRGKLPWPVRGPLLASYGQAKADGRLKWNGLWIGADRGAPVRAVANGRIAYVGWLQRYGLLVIVEHDGGYFSLYGHNQTADARLGDSVSSGQVIGTVGDTGGHPKTGLYFELRAGKEPVDPRGWLGG